jgi:hypothetical protein
VRRPGAAPVVTLILDDVSDDRLEAWLAAAREQLSHPITPARLREEVETLGRLRWPNGANKAAELEDLYYDVAAKHYPEPVIVEAFRRLRESKIFKPEIATVLRTCAVVYIQARGAIRRRQEQFDGRREDAALMVKRADDEVRDMMDEPARRELDMAEYCARIPERRREAIAEDRSKLAKDVNDHDDLAAQLRARYAGTVGMDGFLKWEANEQRKLAERRADIMQREADLAALEERYEREGLWRKLPAPLKQLTGPKPAPFRHTIDGRFIELDPELPQIEAPKDPQTGS